MLFSNFYRYVSFATVGGRADDGILSCDSWRSQFLLILSELQLTSAERVGIASQEHCKRKRKRT